MRDIIDPRAPQQADGLFHAAAFGLAHPHSEGDSPKPAWILAAVLVAVALLADALIVSRPVLAPPHSAAAERR